jgi:hypothetical protein
MAKMRCPRYTNRKLLILIALIGAIAGFVTQQVKWINERQEFKNRNNVTDELFFMADTPWRLRIFGERSPGMISVPPGELSRARELFPESIIADATANRVVYVPPAIKPYMNGSLAP